jgi:hypothetical protein
MKIIFIALLYYYPEDILINNNQENKKSIITYILGERNVLLDKNGRDTRLVRIKGVCD